MKANLVVLILITSIMREVFRKGGYYALWAKCPITDGVSLSLQMKLMIVRGFWNWRTLKKIQGAYSIR